MCVYVTLSVQFITYPLEMHSEEDLSKVQQIIAILSKKRSLKNYEIRIKGSVSKQDSFFGDITMIELKAENGDGKEEVLQLVIKIAPKNEQIRQMGAIRPIFLAEDYFYSVVYPTFRRFQEDHNISNTFCSVPKCYCTIMEECQEALALENLLYSGFIHLKKNVLMDDAHIIFALKEYGKFHAISLAIKELEPATYEELSKNHVFNVVGQIVNSIEDSIMHLYEKIKQHFDEKEDHGVIRKMDEFGEKMCQCILETLSSAEYSVFIHGDPWINNLMFKYADNETEEPMEMCILDWQVMSSTSPILDISILIYICCRPENLKKIDFYLEIYHRSISSSLEEYGLNVDNVFPYSTLKQNWKSLAKHALPYLMFNVKRNIAYNENTITLEKGVESGNIVSAFVENSTNEEEYYNTMTKIIKHLYDNDSF